jgi:L-lactate dehydrogenase (cytochrome)
LHVQEHPGGPEIILKYAGCDATSAYETIHSVDLLDAHLPKLKHLGEIEPDAAVFLQKQEQGHGSDTSDNERTHPSRMEKPPLSWILNLKDMEVHLISERNRNHQTSPSPSDRGS